MILHNRTWGDGTTTTTDPSTDTTGTDPSTVATDAGAGAADATAQVLAIQQNADALAAAATNASWNIFLGMIAGGIVTIGVMFTFKKISSRKGKK